MKKYIATLALVAFTAALYAGDGCGKCAGDKKDGDKAKTEGKCPSGGCSKDKKDEKKS
jgi:hypothetical protein